MKSNPKKFWSSILPTSTFTSTVVLSDVPCSNPLIIATAFSEHFQSVFAIDNFNVLLSDLLSRSLVISCCHTSLLPFIVSHMTVIARSNKCCAARHVGEGIWGRAPFFFNTLSYNTFHSFIGISCMVLFLVTIHTTVTFLLF